MPEMHPGCAPVTAHHKQGDCQTDQSQEHYQRSQAQKMELVGPCLEDGEIQTSTESSPLDTTRKKETRQAKGNLEKDSRSGEAGTEQDMA